MNQPVLAQMTRSAPSLARLLVTLAALLAAVLLFPPANAGEERPVSRIALGSCARQDRPQPIWEHVTAADPDLFLLLGDNVYGDTEDMEVLRRKYADLGAQPGFRKLRGLCPVLAIWDDHDYGVNDGGAEYPMKAESQQVMLDFFGEPADSPRRSRPGIYDARLYGPPGRRLQVVLLDTRYFRSPLKKRQPPVRGLGPYVATDDPASTLLGEAQWRWLEAQLRVPAQVRIIASSIQVVPEDHGWEKWMNFPHERQRLFRLIRETGAGGVVFVSGDRHLAELSMMDGGVGYPLYDLTSSGLNNASQRWRGYETNRHRVGTMNWGDNFGLIQIDWERADPRIRFQIRDDEGDVVLQRKINLTTIQPGTIR